MVEYITGNTGVNRGGWAERGGAKSAIYLLRIVVFGNFSHANLSTHTSLIKTCLLIVLGRLSVESRLRAA